MIGPNGAGKTTILKSLIRQLKPIKGVAVLDGVKTETMNGPDFCPEAFSCVDGADTS